MLFGTTDKIKAMNSAIEFCFILKLLRACLRAGFQLGGWINGPKIEKTLGSNLELSFLENN